MASKSISQTNLTDSTKSKFITIDHFPLRPKLERCHDSHEKKSPVKKLICLSVLLSLVGLILLATRYQYYPTSIKYFHYQSIITINNQDPQSTYLIRNELPITYFSAGPVCDTVEANQRFDCLPDNPTNESLCVERGCCWRPTNNSQDPGQPFCYFPQQYNHYQVILIQYEASKTIVTLQRTSALGLRDEIEYVKVEVIEVDESTVRVRFTNPEKSRFEVPLPHLNLPPQRDVPSPQYSVLVTSNDNLLTIRRKSTNTIILQTDLGRLIYSDQMIKISNIVPSSQLYGLGEHVDSFKKDFNWRRYTMFARDIAPVEKSSLYGSYPFYLMAEDSENAHGIMLFNSNAMDVILQPSPAVTYITTGGILDFFVFLGPSPKDVVSQNVKLLGTPLMPPYWALGFHLCRYGYNSLETTRKTWQRNRDAGIPFDVQWNDIDFMHKRNDFTYDEDKFKGFRAFIDEVHQSGMKYVLMFDPGISAGQVPGSYPPFDDGVKMDIFIKNSSGQLYLGHVWNEGPTVWPDFTNPEATDYWTRQFARFHKELPFDGSWIDMNEPSNFDNNQIDRCPDLLIESPPYVPGGIPLKNKTVCMSALHNVSTHYNLHNLYGLYETKATNAALRTVLKKRPFIISRSTYFGQGHYGGHWSGDVYSTWPQLRWAIVNMLNYNMFGTPMIGSDICGFNGDVTPDLCARWSSVGAFYPFSRNHNSDEAVEQDPAFMGKYVLSAAKNALNLKYKFLPYLYTLFYRAHKYAETVVRPLMFEYFNDPKTGSIEDQFLWGSSLMVIPIVQNATIETTAYFPTDTWYLHVKKDEGFNRFESKGEYKNLTIQIDEIGLAIRGGSILPTHSPAITTVEALQKPYSILVAPDSKNKAIGELFIDNGDNLDSLTLGEYGQYNFNYDNNKLSVTADLAAVDPEVESVNFLGVDKKPTRVLVNGEETTSFTFSDEKKELNVTDLRKRFSSLKTVEFVSP